MQDAKIDSALKLLEIGYRLIKKYLIFVYNIFRKLARQYFRMVDILLKWKLSQLYFIFKLTKWNYNLAITHPILLLEYLYKCIVKVLTRRLSFILKQHNILQGPNFCSLQEKSTYILIIN